jgi:hypothetical protein
MRFQFIIFIINRKAISLEIFCSILRPPLQRKRYIFDTQHNTTVILQSVAYYLLCRGPVIEIPNKGTKMSSSLSEDPKVYRVIANSINENSETQLKLTVTSCDQNLLGF